MKKLSLLFLVVLAVGAVYYLRSEKFGTTDVFMFLVNEGEIEVEVDSEDEGKTERVAESAGYYYVDQSVADEMNRYDEFDSEPVGAVLSPSELFGYENRGYFESLSEARDVETFVIVGENHSWRGKDVFMGSDYGFEGSFGKIEVDLELLSELEVESNFYSLFEERSVYGFLPLIARYFPEARVVAVSVKDFADEEEVSSFVQQLVGALGENDFVIFSTKFAEGFDETVSSFQNELTEQVVVNLDEGGISQLSVDSRPVIRVMMEWAGLSGNEGVEVLDHGYRDQQSFFVVNLLEGEKKQVDRDLTVLAFGDMMLGRFVRTLMNSNGLDYIFENIAGHEKRFFEGADIVHGNLEGPIKGEGRSGGTSMVFSFNEDTAPLLKKYGFTMVSISNNHATDQGWDGRDTTISALEGAGVGWCGHPSEADYESVYYSKVGDKKVAFLCFHDVTYKLDDQAALELIRSVRPNVDYLLVSIHWGYEYKHSPTWGNQVEPGHAFIDAGADFVIGHHPHVVQSFEVYNGRLIFYSLGNFIFDQYWSKATQEQLGIGIVLDDPGKEGGLKTKVYLFPMKSEMSQPRLMTEAERAEWIERFIGYGEYDEEMKSDIRSGVITVP